MLFLKIVFHCREGLFETPIRYLFLERHSILFLISLFHWCWYRLKLCVSLVYNCWLKPGVYFSPSCLQKGKISQRNDSRSVNRKSKNGKIWTSYNKSHDYPSRRSSCVLLSFSLIKLINSRLHCCLSLENLAWCMCIYRFWKLLQPHYQEKSQSWMDAGSTKSGQHKVASHLEHA